MRAMEPLLPLTLCLLWKSLWLVAKVQNDGSAEACATRIEDHTYQLLQALLRAYSRSLLRVLACRSRVTRSLLARHSLATCANLSVSCTVCRINDKRSRITVTVVRANLSELRLSLPSIRIPSYYSSWKRFGIGNFSELSLNLYQFALTKHGWNIVLVRRGSPLPNLFQLL